MEGKKIVHTDASRVGQGEPEHTHQRCHTDAPTTRKYLVINNTSLPKYINVHKYPVIEGFYLERTYTLSSLPLLQDTGSDAKR